MKKIKQSKYKILEGMLFYLVLREGVTKEWEASSLKIYLGEECSR